MNILISVAFQSRRMQENVLVLKWLSSFFSSFVNETSNSLFWMRLVSKFIYVKNGINKNAKRASYIFCDHVKTISEKNERKALSLISTFNVISFVYRSFGNGTGFICHKRKLFEGKKWRKHMHALKPPIKWTIQKHNTESQNRTLLSERKKTQRMWKICWCSVSQ